MKSIKLKPRQFLWLKILFGAWIIVAIFCGVSSVIIKEEWCFIGIAAMAGIGVLYIATIRQKVKKVKKISCLMENFIRKNQFFQSTFEKRHFLTHFRLKFIYIYKNFWFFYKIT